MADAGTPPPPGTARLPLVERFFSPIQQFTRISSSGGIVLLATTIVALIWANTAWGASYHHLWESQVGVRVGPWSLAGTLHQFINDGLMAVFFFLVGLEIKREVLAGELSSVRSAALPMVAAVGGMIVPAGLYAVLNVGGAGVHGWGIPMATDIAFALGVLALLGSRVPSGVKVFLAALAIVDDIGAVLVIAVFYSGGINVVALGAAAVLLLVSVAANAAGVRQPWAYGAVGFALWGAVAMSGIHTTVAGVLLALTIPVRTRVNESDFLAQAQGALDEFERAAVVTTENPRVTVLSNTRHHTALEELESLADQARPPLIRMEHSLHGLVAFGIMPLFALANAGVVISGASMTGAFTSPLALGIVVGLVVGKPLGIMGLSWLAVRLGIASLPTGVTWRMITGVGLLGGIGFTMALFIAGLAFESPLLLDTAKMGVLVGSIIAGVVGWLLLRSASHPSDAHVQGSRARIA